MKNKYISLVIFSGVFALCIALVICANTISNNYKKKISQLNKPNTEPVISTVIEEGGTTAVVTVKPNPNSQGHYSPSDIINDYLNQNSYSKIFTSPVFGININKSNVDYLLEGTAVTTVYDTETTTLAGETLPIEPIETTSETKKPADTTKSPETDVTVKETTTASPETKPAEVDSTTIDQNTTTDTTTTTTETSADSNTAETPAEPIDNSEGAMLN